MKINRHGRAKILTQEEIQLVFTDAYKCENDKIATQNRRHLMLDTSNMFKSVLSKGSFKKRIIPLSHLRS